MAVTLQFEQDGQLIQYDIPDGRTIELPTISAETLYCQIPELNVRINRSTAQKEVATLTIGDAVTVSTEAIKHGIITWRQILAPAHLAGYWTAERVDIDPQIYLAPNKPKSTVTHHTNQEAQPPPPPTSNPAQLNGRFQLKQVTKDDLTYTALAIDGDTQPRLGVNVREFVYFGTPQWKHTTKEAIDEYAKTISDMGMTWVRFYAPHVDAAPNLMVEKVRYVLDTLNKYNLLAVMCLGDSISLIRLYPAGDEDWHKEDMGHLHKDYYNGNHYETHYWPLVDRLVDEFKDHPAMGIWQLLNEPAIYPAPASEKDLKGFTSFVDRTSKRIYEKDQTHPISIGIINTAHIMPPGRNLSQFAADFYKNRRYIHIATSHSYQFEHEGNSDSAWEHEHNCAVDAKAATQNGRAFIWTEFGASQAGNRVASTQRFLSQHVIEGAASGALQWGFMLPIKSNKDVGVGDKRFGFSKASFNKEFDELQTFFKKVSKR